MQAIRIIGGAISLAVMAFFFWPVKDVSNGARISSGGSKFVSVNQRGKTSWRLPTQAEQLARVGWLMGEGSFDQMQARNQEMTTTISNALDMANEMGVATGPTLFDPEIERAKSGDAFKRIEAD